METSNGKISTVLITTLILCVYFSYMLHLIDPIYTKLGFNARAEDTHLDIKLRQEAVSILFMYSLNRVGCT